MPVTEQCGALSTQHAAEYLGVSPRTLEDWRVRGGGPRYARLGRGRGRVVYRLTDLERYLAERAESHTSAR
jgi:excisionase family DNA binding protein